VRSLVSPGFRKLFDRLPAEIRDQARRAYATWRKDPARPGLDFKKLKVADAYSARVGIHYRATRVKVAEDRFRLGMDWHACGLRQASAQDLGTPDHLTLPGGQGMTPEDQESKSLSTRSHRKCKLGHPTFAGWPGVHFLQKFPD
jgi:hypothetical protein